MRFTRVVLCTLAAVALLAACSSGGETVTEPPATSTTAPTGGSSSDPLAPQPLAEPYTIRMTMPVKIEIFSQALLADYFGEFEKENIVFELVEAPTTESYVLLSNEATDVHISSPVAGFFNSIDQGLDVRWVAGVSTYGPESPTGIWVRADWFDDAGEIDVTKMRGARISLGPTGWGDTAAGFFKEWLEDNGLTVDDIEIQQLNVADAIPALQGGRIDGAVLTDPSFRQVHDDGTAKLFLSYPEGSMFVGYFAGPNLLENNREAGEAFFRAIARTTATYLQGNYHDDPEVVAALSAVTGAPEASIEASEPLLFDPSLAILPEAILGAQEAWLSIGGILAYPEAIVPADFIDESLIADLQP